MKINLQLVEGCDPGAEHVKVALLPDGRAPGDEGRMATLNGGTEDMYMMKILYKIYHMEQIKWYMMYYDI